MSRDRNTLPAMIRAAMPILCVAVSRTGYPYDWRFKPGKGLSGEYVGLCHRKRLMLYLLKFQRDNQ